jgi:LacI family transcriptional regulator
VGAIQSIHSLSSLQVPRDISIVGFDDIIWGTATHPRLTTVHVDKKLMGQLAVARALSVLEERDHTVTSTTITTELILRESTAQASPGIQPAAT